MEGVGMGTDVHVHNLPTTSHGFANKQMTAAAAARGKGIAAGAQKRQIYDRGYYLNQLKYKNIDLVNEITKLKQEVEDIEKDNQLFKTNQKKFEDQIKEVRLLEGELADYNLALDKHRSDTKPEDIMAVLYHIQNQNERQKRDLDETFLERKQMEEQLTDLEENINHINLANEERMNELDPEQRAQYEGLKDENNHLEQEIGKYRMQLEEVNHRLAMADSQLRIDTVKQRSAHLREEKYQLNTKKEELELVTDELNLPFGEARERLVNKTKEDQVEIKQLESRTIELKKIVDQYNKQARDIEKDLEHKKTDSADMQKYEILHEKDQQMTQFIDSFEIIKQKEDEEVHELENRIANILEQISKHMKKQSNLPSYDEALNLQNEFEYKERQMKDAKSTYERLQFELEKRTEDLKKLEHFDTKTENDFKNLHETMNKMREEIGSKFNNVQAVTEKFQMEKRRLSRLKTYYESKSRDLSQQVAYHTMKYDKKSKQLQANETYKGLREIENKITQNEGNVFNLQQFIEAKTQESNTSGLANQCVGLAHNLNADIIKGSLAVKMA